MSHVQTQEDEIFTGTPSWRLRESKYRHRLRGVTGPSTIRQVLDKYLADPDNKYFQAFPDILNEFRYDSPNIVAFVLEHNYLDPNGVRQDGTTAFSECCFFGWTKSARLLIRDPRVNLDIVDGNDCFPLWYAVSENNLGIIKLWIASGREMNLTGLPREPRLTTTKGRETRELLRDFQANPESIRFKVRVETGEFLGEAAAEVFALVVFLCDDLLSNTFSWFKSIQESIQNLRNPEDVDRMIAVLRNRDAQLIKNTDAAKRFFRIASQLPLELQMELCLRVVGSMEEVIPAEAREAAFRALAEKVGVDDD